jgi:uncharacterized protein with GYD domain
MLMKMTPDGATMLKNWPESIEKAMETLNEMGLKLIGWYACGAVYDFIGIGEVPNAETAEMFRHVLVSAGLVEAQAIRLFTKEEFFQLINAIPE